MKVNLPFRPMLAELGRSPEDGKYPYPFGKEDFAFETKWDGHRAVAWARPGRDAALFGRSGRNITDSFPEISMALAEVRAEVILDGELVALDDRGRSSMTMFARNKRMSADERSKRLRYIAFDVVSFDDESIAHMPYKDRQVVLMESLATQGDPIMRVPYHTDGIALWQIVMAHQLEGLIAKPLHSAYQFGNRGTWMKIKANQRGVFTIIGYTAGEGARAGTFGALIIGSWVGDELRYVGKVGTGFTAKTVADLSATFAPLVVEEPYLSKAEQARARPHVGKAVTWLKPELAAEVEYSELTEAGTPRFPSYKALLE